MRENPIIKNEEKIFENLFLQERAVKSQESPLPDSFNMTDLLELVDSTEMERMESGEEARRITRGIRQLASSDDNLR